MDKMCSEHVENLNTNGDHAMAITDTNLTDGASETPPSDGRPTGFMDLPPEIRNRIYFHALHCPNHIRVDHRQWIRQHDYKKHFTLEISTVIKSGKGKNGGKKITVPHSQALNTTILQTSRVIHREAKGILCGANRFVFKSCPTVNELRKKLGWTQFACLRDVKIVEVNPRTFKDLMQMLGHLKNPTRVEIPVSVQTSDTIEEKVAWLWDQIIPFVAPGVYYGDSVDIEELRRRFDSLRFFLRPKSRSALAYASSTKIDNTDDAHAWFKAALLLCLEKYHRKKVEERATWLETEQARETTPA